MIRLMKDNVERIAHNEVDAKKWEGDGFRRTGTRIENAPPQKGKSLGDMNMEELKALAKSRKIAGYSALNKDDLLAILEESGHDGTGETENPDE